jgi:hypothetical protein
MSSDDKGMELEKAQLLWDEYKYRHELCWKLIFQVTAAVAIVSIIPFTQVDIAKALGYWMVSLPALGIILTLFSIARMNKELDILEKIRTKHRELHKILYDIEYKPDKSTFSRDVKVYLIGLILLNMIDIIAIVLVWIPTL